MRASLSPVLVPLTLLVAFAGCGESFKPASTVERLRVLGIRSEPAELHPGDTAHLSALVTDPGRPGKQNTVVWFSCDPDPTDLSGSTCSNFATLEDPSSLFGAPSSEGGAPELPPGMHLAGFGTTASYSAPADLFSQLPADDVRRTSGALVQMLMLAVAEEVSPAATQEEISAVLDRVRKKEVASVLSIFRVRVTESAQLNNNPVLGGITVDGELVPEGAHVRFREANESRLGVAVTDADFETWEQVTPTGTEARTEKLILAWYATQGAFSKERVALRESEDTLYAAPGSPEVEPVPPGRRGTLWAVVRDTRGGQSWLEVPTFVCDAPASTPTVSALTPETANPGQRVTLEGEHLERVLDVVVGDRALRGAEFVNSAQTFEGVLPPLPSGTHKVVLRLRDGSDIDTGRAFQVP